MFTEAIERLGPDAGVSSTSFSKSFWFGRVADEVEVMGSIVQLGSGAHASFQQNVQTFIDIE